MLAQVSEHTIARNVKKYRDELVKEGFTPEKFPEGSYVDDAHYGKVKQHMLWVCNQVLGFIEKEESDLAKMWYGFLQGCMWAASEHTIEELRQDNVP